ncbi:MAG: Hg(II)-responsive transcriptional regulator [Gammaproteobacteria bacterium]|nr:Hg(II)-responsive transcriptional regulator [Gammaproteobacteria bacterium]
MKIKTFSIGKLAQAAGVNVETVRYYQRRKLVKTPVRPNQGFRVYPVETLHRIKFIKRAQELGFSLIEIEQLLTLSAGNCAAMEDLARHKLVKIKDKISDLHRMQTVLSELVEACETNQDPQTCPIIESLAAESTRHS